MKLRLSRNIRIVIFLSCITLCTMPFMNPPFALLLGFVFSTFIGHPLQAINSKATNLFLKVSVVGLGFGLNVTTALEAGKQGVWLTIVFIFVTIILGFLIGKMLGISRKTSHLLASGTAICGGSAIAAVAPVIDASENEISVSLGTIFLLNSVALLVFPLIGHYYELSQQQFGMWSAIAIHDTSSVVGAASSYGDEALKTATTLKLARTLWIIPLALFSAFIFRGGKKKIKIPFFILWFILAMLANTYFDFVKDYSGEIVKVAKTGLTITLFLIGAGLSFDKIKAVGWKPLLLGVLLWIFISVSSFLVINNM